MTKLTVTMKDAITENALDTSGYNAKHREYKQRRRAWAEAVADASIGGEESRLLLQETQKKVDALIKKLPENLRGDEVIVGPTTRGIYASFGGMHCHVGEWEGYRPAINMPMFAADHPLTIEFELLEQQSKELSSMKDQVRQQVRAVLGSVSTVKQLLTAWPESVELLPEYTKPKPTLPAVQIGSINKLVGLPTEQEQE